MEQKVRICKNCGNICGMEDSFCKKCSSDNIELVEQKETAIKGIDDSAIVKIVDKRDDYYLEKFRKSKGKSFYFQINWAAILLGPCWYFYRKMYKEGLLLTAASVLLTVLLIIFISLGCSGKVDELKESQKAYNDFYANDGESYFEVKDKDGNITRIINPEYEKLSNNLESAENSIKVATFFISFLPFLYSIFIGLIGNFFYKRHVIRQITEVDSSLWRIGTSPGAGVACYFSVDAINVAITFLLYLIPFVNKFLLAI